MTEQRCPVCRSLVKTSSFPIIMMVVIVAIMILLFVAIYVKYLLAERATQTCTSLCQHRTNLNPPVH